jgi:hypothetical protein
LGLPIFDSFVNLRQGFISKDTADDIVSQLDWPLEGMLFDLENNDFWINSWGNKPATYQQKGIIVRQKYSTFPKLIPIYSLRYIPMGPMEKGNPVFSVHQMDKAIQHAEYCIDNGIQKKIHPLQKEIAWGYHIPYLISGFMNEHPKESFAWMDSERRKDFVGFLMKMCDIKELLE